ncbi:hypothetical protein D7S81_16420 [Ralstonia insidiosa]|nr:hypothetical protein [Ralstonia insidiosa]MBA9938197.1 hypothetical protein [Ralstonia insidiosa]MBA9950765.1 hypothetical protein [Ralstonia insidiosa]MBA9970615.1 hypothetical protein [Ralstonia insidiosa]
MHQRQGSKDGQGQAQAISSKIRRHCSSRKVKSRTPFLPPGGWRHHFVKAQIIMRTIPIYKGVKSFF